mgnify:CR=1 FL=1
MSRMARREAIEGYVFLLPWIAGFLIFTAGPIVASFVLSLTEWDILTPPQWNGLGNYAAMLFEDRLFWQSLKVTVVYAASFIPIGLVLSLLVALLMNQKVPGITVFRTIYYLPSVVSGVAVALLWAWVFNQRFGVLNSLLWLLGIEGPDWLVDERTALMAFVIMGLWGIGGGMIIKLAALQGIPTELYEAAHIDGANWWHRFWAVTIPMITPVLFLNLVTGIIGTLQIFTTAFVMTMGGPNYATYFFALHLYLNAFQYFRMGYAAALAWFLFLVILFLTLLVFKSSQYWVYYAGEREERR